MLRFIPLSLIPIGLIASPHAIAARQVYEIDSQHTHIVWRVDRFGFTQSIGTFVDIEGTVCLDEAAPENSSVQASIAVSGLRSDLPQREEIVRGPFWLNADAHPVISFESTDIHLTSDESCPTQCAHVTGLLSLSGETAPVTLMVTLNKLGQDPVTKKKAAGFSASGAFQRSEFGIATALGPIGDKVDFEVEALAVAVE